MGGPRIYRFPRVKRTCQEWNRACKRGDKRMAGCASYFPKKATILQMETMELLFGYHRTNGTESRAEPSQHVKVEPHACVFWEPVRTICGYDVTISRDTSQQ